MTTYLEKLKSPKWQKKRLEILQRDNFTCQLCSDTETELQVHHLKYTGEPYEAPNNDLQTLCKHCHELIEHLKDVLEPNEIPKVKKFKGKIVLTSRQYTFIFSLNDNILVKEGFLAFNRNSDVLKFLYETNKL